MSDLWINPRKVASGLIQAGDEAMPDRVARREDDRDRRSCRLDSVRRTGTSRRDNNADAALHQIGRQRWQSVVLALGRAVFDRDVLALEIAGLLEALEGRRN